MVRWPVLARRWSRVAGVGLLAAVMSVATLSSGSAHASTTTAGSIVAVGWRDSHSGGGQFPGSDVQGGTQGQNPWGSSSGNATVDSVPATEAESAGVVLIDTVLGYQNAAAAGTGIVLTSDGEVLTNYHVIAGATSISVTIAATGQTYDATVVGHDQTGDIALLQLKDASGLKTATIDDDTVSTGDRVTAVGNAGGTSSLTAAAGTVTALEQQITTESEGAATGEDLTGLIETSADVVAGDSGGPLYDNEGEVIGIDTAASTGTEINGYAIPIDDALAIVQQIESGHETSTVQIGLSAFLGVEVSSASSSASDANAGWNSNGSFAEESGAVVAGVIAGSPAANAGLTTGDVITAVGGTTIGTPDQLSKVLAGHDAGDRVGITWTDSFGQSQSATVTLASSPVA